MASFSLKSATPEEWITTVLNDFDRFLQDHAAAEKKAAGMAISMASHYPDKPDIVEAMADLAVEEMTHYREVVKIIHQRGGQTAADEKDAYVIAFREHMRKGSELYFLDRLLIAGIIEARGAERFGLIAEHINDSKLTPFYQAIARSESRHLELFRDLALAYFPQDAVDIRLEELLNAEAALIAAQPLRATLH